jgi:hypothetical protein
VELVAEVSPKSRPACWWYPLATRRALCLSIVPSAFLFNLKTHLQSTTFEAVVGGTRDQVLFWRRALNSVCIAALHSGMVLALEKQVGSAKVSSWTVSNARAMGYRTIPSCSFRG